MGDKKFSDLPEDLLVSIAERFDDTNRFRAVCRSWRFSVGRHRVVQLPIFSFWVPRVHDYVPILHDIKLLETTVYCLEQITTGKRMLIRVREYEEEDQIGKVDIMDPFGRSIQFGGKKVIDLLNFRVSKITKFYNLHGIPCDVFKCPIERVRACHKVPVAIMPSAYNNNFPILASHHSFSNCYFGNLAECLIYNGTLTNFDNSSRIAQHKGKLYEASDKHGFVQVYDYSLVPGAKINIPGSDLDYIDKPGVDWRRRRCYYYILVSCGGDLFLVKRLMSLARYKQGGGDKDYIQVYKLEEEEEEEEEQQRWVQVRSLGDRAFILCDDRSFAVSVQDFAGIERGVFYFLDTNLWYEGESEEIEPKDCVWAFSLEKGTLWRLPHDGRGLFY